MILANINIVGKTLAGLAGGTADTTADGKQAVFVLADSIGAGGAATTNSTLPTAGTAYEYDRNTNTILNFGAGTPFTPFQPGSFSNNPKSPWAKFCIDYNAATGFKPVIINRGCSSSTISVGNNSNHWQTSGTNYNLAVTAANDCLSKLGLTKLKYIFIVLGINDASGLNNTSANTVAQVGTALDTLITNLQTQFGSDVPIVFNMMGKFGTAAFTLRLVQSRKMIRDRAVSNASMYIGCTMQWLPQAGYMASDGLHPETAGNDAMGSMFARWCINSSYTKWARSIIACHPSAVSTTLKNKIQTLITARQTEILNLDMLYLWKGMPSRLDTFFDYTFLNCGETDLGHTYSSSFISTDGSSTCFNTGHNSAFANFASQNDTFATVKIAGNHSAAGTGIQVLGQNTTGIRIVLGKNSSNQLIWNVNAAAPDKTYATETQVSTGEWRIQRTGATTSALFKNNTQVDTNTNASTGMPGAQFTGWIFIGAFDAGTNVPTQFTAVDCERAYWGAPSLIPDFTGLAADFDTFQS